MVWSSQELSSKVLELFKKPTYNPQMWNNSGRRDPLHLYYPFIRFQPAPRVCAAHRSPLISPTKALAQQNATELDRARDSIRSEGRKGLCRGFALRGRSRPSKGPGRSGDVHDISKQDIEGSTARFNETDHMKHLKNTRPE